MCIIILTFSASCTKYNAMQTYWMFHENWRCGCCKEVVLEFKNLARCICIVLYCISLGPQPVVQCFLTSALGKFPAIGTGYCILGYRLCCVHCLFPIRLPYLGVFPFTLLLLPLDFIRVSSLRPTYLHPFGRFFTYSLVRWVSRLVTGSGTQCCGPIGGAELRMKQKSRFKSLPWPRFEPRTLQSGDRERYH